MTKKNDTESATNDLVAWVKRSEEWHQKAQLFQVKLIQRGNFSKEIFQRLNGLADNEMYLEYIVLGSQLIEGGIRELIEMYILTINFVIGRSSLLVKEIKLIESSINDRDTLGSLIMKLKQYSINQDLLANLDKLNKLRIDVVHRLHEKKKPLNEINDSFKKHIDENLIGTISLQILKQGGVLSNRLNEILAAEKEKGKNTGSP